MLFKNIFPAGSHQRQPCSCLSFPLKGLPWYYALNYICHLYKIIIIDSAGFYFAFYSHFYQDFQAACHIKICSSWEEQPLSLPDSKMIVVALLSFASPRAFVAGRPHVPLPREGFPCSLVVELTASLRLANAEMLLVCCLLLCGCGAGTAGAATRVSSTFILFPGPASLAPLSLGLHGDVVA